jgi:hypothetical protein
LPDYHHDILVAREDLNHLGEGLVGTSIASGCSSSVP